MSDFSRTPPSGQRVSAGGGVGLKSDTGYTRAFDEARDLEQSIVAGVERSDPPAERGVAGSPSPTPAMYSTLGRADGLALARGEASASGDLLAALLWHAGLGSWLLLLVSDFSRTPPQAVPEEQMSDRGPTPGA